MILPIMLVRILIAVVMMPMRNIPALVIIRVMIRMHHMDQPAMRQQRMRRHRWPNRHQHHRNNLAEQPHFTSYKLPHSASQDQSLTAPLQHPS